MKRLIVLLLLSQLGFSQNTITKYLGDFNKITTFDKIEATIIPSKENKITIEGPEANEVELINKSGELKIRMPFNKVLKGDNISVTIYFKNIDAIEANEGSSIFCDSVLKFSNFEINAKETSQVNLNIISDRIVLKASTGALVNLEGKCINYDILLNTGAILRSNNMIANQSSITVNAGGEADIYAMDIVDAKVRAGGIISIFGKPKNIIQKTIAGGTIRVIND